MQLTKETKSGVLTSEFWVCIAVMLGTLTDVIPLPERFEGYVVGAIALAYALARGLAKLGVPEQPTIGGTVVNAGVANVSETPLDDDLRRAEADRA